MQFLINTFLKHIPFCAFSTKFLLRRSLVASTLADRVNKRSQLLNWTDLLYLPYSSIFWPLQWKSVSAEKLKLLKARAAAPFNYAVWTWPTFFPAAGTSCRLPVRTTCRCLLRKPWANFHHQFLHFCRNFAPGCLLKMQFCSCEMCC